MRIAIVIVNYRTGRLVVDCLASIAEHATGAPPRAIVVDNDSPDDSAGEIEQAISERGWQGWATIVRAGVNGGFAAGNNVGIRAAIAEDPSLHAVLLLNPDTVVRAGAVNELVAFMDAHPGAGIAGSRLEDPDTTAQRSAFRFPTIAGELESAARLGVITRLLRSSVIAPPVRDTPHRTDWVAGASMMIRRDVFEQIGLLDESYFMYYEEVEFCRRAASAGWGCWYVPASRVVHLVGQASGVVHGQPTRRPRYWFDSRRRYFVTQHGRVGAALADLAWIVGAPVHRAVSTIKRRPPGDPAHLIRDLLVYGALNPGGSP
ncbi:MAG: glycosyltransferase family 2 protein [Phycisphaerales bacterium]